jgi:hypothetical protein
MAGVRAVTGVEGRFALEGAAIGILVGVWSVGSLAILVRGLMRDRPEPAKGVRQTLLMGVLKLPVTLFGLYEGTTLPEPGLGCFLAGLGLVYCFSAWFLVRRSHE